MAISARAQAELDAFAEEAEHAAAIGHEPWAASQLRVSHIAARTGQRVTVQWEVPGDLPAFLQVGANADWVPVPARGQRELRVGLDDLSVSLRAGPHRVKSCAIRALVPAPALAVFPEKPLRIAPGETATVEVYAALARTVEMRDSAGSWTALPPRARLDIADVWLDRVIHIRATGWEGTVLHRQIHIQIDFGRVTAQAFAFDGGQECVAAMPD